jgi:hypothetical protein
MSSKRNRKPLDSREQIGNWLESMAVNCWGANNLRRSKGGFRQWKFGIFFLFGGYLGDNIRSDFFTSNNFSVIIVILAKYCDSL